MFLASNPVWGPVQIRGHLFEGDSIELDFGERDKRCTCRNAPVTPVTGTDCLYIIRPVIQGST